MKNPALWNRLQAHRFDAPGATQPFSVKLAMAEGWDADYTAAVIEEYRRFLYLTQISDGQVTPSIPVDRAWHMHLTFTRDYWEVLCPKVLGRALHHEPCRGPEEMPRYHRQFDQTRNLYLAEFGALPPAHVWGGGDTSDKAPKRFVQAGLYGVSAGVILLFLGLSRDWIGNVLLGCLVIAIFVIAFQPQWLNRRKKKRKKGDPNVGSGGCGGCGSGGRSSKGETSSSDGGSDGGGGCGGGGCGGGGA